MKMTLRTDNLFNLLWLLIANLSLIRAEWKLPRQRKPELCTKDLLRLFITNIFKDNMISCYILQYHIHVVTFIYTCFPMELFLTVMFSVATEIFKQVQELLPVFCKAMILWRLHRRRTFHYVVYMLICLYVILVTFRITYHVIFERWGNVTYFRFIF